jgi:type IV pilus assembly protein PilY1
MMRSRAVLATGTALAAGLAAVATIATAQSYMISNVPLAVPSALQPNIILTLDDSAPMRNAFSPDGAFPTVADAKSRRFKSSAFNPLYYDPTVTYVAPPHGSEQEVFFNDALANGFDPTRNSELIDLATGYRPTYSYDPFGMSTSPGHVYAAHYAADIGPGKITAFDENAKGPAYYYVYDTSLAGCTANLADDNCYALRLVTSTSGPGSSDERQNFANWYSYYRTRTLAMSSAAGRAMGHPSLQGTRVAFQALNTCNSFATGNTCQGYGTAEEEKKKKKHKGSTAPASVSNLIRTFDDVALDNLYSWLRRIPAAGNTPLRAAMARAGDYFRTGSSVASNNPYRERPNTADPGVEHACRPNFHLLMTGSVYDGSDSGNYCSGSACGNTDGSPRTLPDNVSYTGSRRPYSDANTNSLADIALHYWASDLRPDLANVLLPYFRDRSGGNAEAQYWNPKNDPARWQHMVNFTVGIGVGRSFSDPNIPWTGDSFGGSGYANLLSGAAQWPATTAGSAGRIYDLWHAALNSRGEFFSANVPEQIVAAINAALSRTIDQSDVGASLAANSTRLTTESQLYQASFDTRDWTGRLRSIVVNTDGSLGQSAWEATAPGKIPDAAARQIFTSSAATTGIDFTWPALGNAGLQPRIGNEATLNYLRGDQSNEIANGGSFRNRSVRLGDIVNSEIAFVGTESFGYDALVNLADLSSPESVAGLAYTPYLRSKSTRTRLVLAGANDGMLHGFDANTGAEKFAFVPRALLLDQISGTDPRSNLVRLADPAYTHRFYVDGSSWVGDAYWGGAWHTVVVGTTGAGGKGVFALDITDPDTMTAAKVLWDLDGHSDPNLGHTIGQPVIGRLHDGQFYAIFGNGYRSTNECPVLYIVRLHDGQVRRLAAGGRSLTDSCAEPNGLGRPSLFDIHPPGAIGYRTTDFVYAGDLRGNVWRFDLRSVNLTNDPPTGAAVNLVFTAQSANGQPQPITGTIEIGAAPAGVSGSGSLPPAMLWFGTGRWFAVDDRIDTSGQTMYGFVDRFGGTIGRSDLVGQTINVTGANAGTITGSTVPYTAAGTGRRDGWYLDLPRSGERMVGLPLIQQGRLLFSTVIPSEDKCAGGGTSSILAVDPYNGTGLSQRIFINYPSVDFISSTVGIVRSLVYIGTGSRAFLYAGGSTGSNVTGSTIQFEEIRPAGQMGVRGRASWREIVK